MSLKTQFEQEVINPANLKHPIDVPSFRPSGPQHATTQLQAALGDIVRICPHIVDFMLRPRLSDADSAVIAAAMIETFDFPLYHLVLIIDDPDRTLDPADIEKAAFWCHEKHVRLCCLEAKDINGPLLDNARRFSAGCGWEPNYMGEPLQALFRATRRKSVPYSKAIDILMNAGLSRDIAENELAGAIARCFLISDLARPFDNDWPVWLARRQKDFTAKSHAVIKLISK